VEPAAEEPEIDYSMFAYDAWRTDGFSVDVPEGKPPKRDGDGE
jgi:hypothetical protein